MKKNLSFKKFYLIFAGVLALVMIFCLVYVGSVLKEYDAAQPENVAIRQVKEMQSAAKKDKLKPLLEIGGDTVDGEFVKKTADLLLSADGELSSRLVKNEKGGEELTYTVSAGDKRIADVTLRSKGVGKTTLVLFTMSEWETVHAGPAAYTYDMTLPGSMSVLLDGQPVEGTDEDGDGRISYYFSEHFTEPSVIIRDSLGNEINYDGISKLDITEYTVKIPSNYKITSDDGSVTVSPGSAVKEAIDDYKYVAEYTEMPEMATYRLGILGEDADFAITDNLGDKVDFTLDGHTVSIEEQASLESIPEDVYLEEDVLAHARKWSLFMSADLTGNSYGYAKVKEFLLPDSYLLEVAYKWATGIDITFTSIHTLDNPPFFEELLSGYVKYSDTCFSVDVKLSKIMHLNTGLDVTDTMNCRMYYINDGGEWYVADIQEIIA